MPHLRQRYHRGSAHLGEEITRCRQRTGSVVGPLQGHPRIAEIFEGQKFHAAAVGALGEVEARALAQRLFQLHDGAEAQGQGGGESVSGRLGQYGVCQGAACAVADEHGREIGRRCM